MISIKQYYTWTKRDLLSDKKYIQISFVTAIYFMGLPIFKYCKHCPNREMEDEEGTYVDLIPRNRGGVYNPSKDESRILMGEVDNNFE